MNQNKPSPSGMPTPSSPSSKDSLVQPSTSGGDMGGIPSTAEGGLMARQDEREDDRNGPTVRPRNTSGTTPSSQGANSDGVGSRTKGPSFTSPSPSPDKVGKDGPLDSLGKAIAEPLVDAADSDKDEQEALKQRR